MKPNYFIWHYLPTLGLLVFCVLFGIATYLYPGGTKFDPSTKGYSFVHNYWCDLNDAIAYNGAHNPARPVAISAMLILCVSFAALCVSFSNSLKTNLLTKRAISFLGVISMFSFSLLFTRFHNEVTNIGAISGGICLLLVFLELRKITWLFRLSMVCFFAACLNFVFYHLGMLAYLPLLQKLTFLLFLIWAVCINQCVNRKP